MKYEERKLVEQALRYEDYATSWLFLVVLAVWKMLETTPEIPWWAPVQALVGVVCYVLNRRAVNRRLQQLGEE